MLNNSFSDGLAKFVSHESEKHLTVLNQSIQGSSTVQVIIPTCFNLTEIFHVSP